MNTMKCATAFLAAKFVRLRAGCMLLYAVGAALFGRCVLADLVPRMGYVLVRWLFNAPCSPLCMNL